MGWSICIQVICDSLSGHSLQKLAEGGLSPLAPISTVV